MNEERPNKAPEPTPGSVTPRATSGVIELKQTISDRDVARGAQLPSWLIFDVGRRMKSGLCFLIFGFALSALGAAPVVEKHPQKDLILQSLQRLVDERSKAVENHFFFLKRKDGEDWIYWREGRLLWTTLFDPYYEQKGPTEIRARSVWDLRLRTPRKPIDLDTGVVPTPKDVGSSTYLVSKDYVAEIVFDCVQDGELVVVRKKGPTRRQSQRRDLSRLVLWNEFSK